MVAYAWHGGGGGGKTEDEAFSITEALAVTF